MTISGIFIPQGLNVSVYYLRLHSDTDKNWNWYATFDCFGENFSNGTFTLLRLRMTLVCWKHLKTNGFEFGVQAAAPHSPVLCTHTSRISQSCDWITSRWILENCKQRHMLCQIQGPVSHGNRQRLYLMSTMQKFILTDMSFIPCLILWEHSGMSDFDAVLMFSLLPWPLHRSWLGICIGIDSVTPRHACLNSLGFYWLD
jgi:hypothetical protein